MEGTAVQSRRRRASIYSEGNRASYRNLNNGNRERISIRTEHYNDPLDYCGRGAVSVLGLNVAAGGLRQPVRRRGEREAALVSRRGVKLWLGRVIVALLLVVLTIMLSVSYAKMMDAQARVASVMSDIENQKAINEGLDRELVNAREDLIIPYEAARMGMVAASRAETITIGAEEVQQGYVAAAQTYTWGE